MGAGTLVIGGLDKVQTNDGILRLSGDDKL